MNGERSEPVSLPDRPGDHDQQQAAEVARAYFGSMWGPGVNAENKELTKRIATARAAARAEEAARWQAKIEALADELTAESEAAQSRADEMRRTDENVRHHTAERRHARVAAHTAAALRTLLDGER